MWFRIDNRLIHGQVIEGWLPALESRHLVVANDELADDELRQEILCLAVSRRVDVRFVRPAELAALLKTLDDATFVLFESCRDVAEAIEAGLGLSVLNIGNIHYKPGSRQLYPHVSLSEEDASLLHRVSDVLHVRLDFRSVPSETPKPVELP